MSVIRGTATVEAQTLTLRFPVSGEDLVHHASLLHREGTAVSTDDVLRDAAEFAAALRARIVVRNERGETIPGRIDTPVWSPLIEGTVTTSAQLSNLHTTYVLTYPLVDAAGSVSLQQQEAPLSRAAPSQIVLATRLDGQPPRVLSLTGGGNVEVLNLTSAHADGSDDRLCHPDRFVLKDAHRTIRLVLQIEDDEIRMTVFLPVPIVETWMALPRAHLDYFEPGEQVQVFSEVKRLLSKLQHVSVNGETRPVHFDQIALLRPGAAAPADAGDTERLDAHTARVYAIMREPVSSPQRVDLEWTLFNGTVLSAQALIVAGETCRDQDLSTYSPQLTWSRE